MAITGAYEDRTIQVTTELIPPETFKIDGTLITRAPSSNTPQFPINQGGSLTGTGGLDITSNAPGSISDSSGDLDDGDSYMVTCVVNELRSMIISFVVDGVEQVTRPTWYANAFGTISGANVTASATIVAAADISGWTFPLPDDGGDDTPIDGDPTDPGDGGGEDDPKKKPKPRIRGCMDPAALNYNPFATEQDACVYPTGHEKIFGCTDPAALNYNASATDSDGSCVYVPPIDPTDDVTKPTYEFLYNGACVVVGTPIRIKFSQKMDATTINTDTIQVWGNGQHIPATVSYNPTLGVVSAEPHASLFQGVTYTVVISGEVKNSRGVAMGTSAIIIFSTCRTYPEPKKQRYDWLGADEPRGMVVRWRDNGRRWSKEHVIDLGLQGDTKMVRELRPMGQFKTRQYEFVMVDRIPQAIYSLQENLHAVTNPPDKGGKSE